MPRKSQTPEPTEFAEESFPGTDPEIPTGGNVATDETPVAPSVKLGQDVFYVLGQHSANAGKVRPAKVVAINDDGTVGLNVLLGHKNDLKLGEKVPGVQFGPVSIPMGSYIVNPADFGDQKAPGTWHLA